MRIVRALIAAALVSAALAPTATRADDDLPWLHVEHRGPGTLPVIADDRGRTVILRGANASGFEDDFYLTADGKQDPKPFFPVDPAAYADGACPANSHDAGQPALCEDDFTEMHALGFNVVRLTLSWSLLEPQPGHIDETYLDRIEQVVEWAKAQGVYVVLDMHQDAYSRFIDLASDTTAPPVVTTTPGSFNHSDGAPKWAIVTDGQPAVGVFGRDFTNARTEGAFTSFWLNRAAPDGVGLQDHYIAALAAVVQRVRHEPAVAGFELMNEPLPGYVQEPAFSAAFLYPFYAKAIRGVTALDSRHLVFFEPMAVRNLVDASAQASKPFTRYPNIVFAPHVYTHVFTADTATGTGAVYPTSYDQAFQTAEAEATAMRAALWIGEYGNSSDQDDTLLAQETAAMDRHTVGGTVWSWKANCGRGASAHDCASTWGTYVGDPAEPPARNLELKPSRQLYLSRVYPRATAGSLVSESYDPATGAFEMSAGGGVGETVLYIPPTVHGAVTALGGAAVEEVVKAPDGSRIATIKPPIDGLYGVSVG